MNWLGHPVPNVESKVKQQKLDILMNFDGSDRITSKYICSIANAKTRAGSYHQSFENCYELMVEMDNGNQVGKNQVGKMIKEFDYFLKMLEK